MSVNAAISLPDIYMSRLENDTKSLFRRSKNFIQSNPLHFFENPPSIVIVQITERKHFRLITKL